MIETVQAEGGTVFFSTHLLHEMERIADEVIIMHEGRVLLRDSVERLKGNRKRLRAVFAGASAPDFQIDTVDVVEMDLEEIFIDVVTGAGGEVEPADPDSDRAVREHAA